MRLADASENQQLLNAIFALYDQAFPLDEQIDKTELLKMARQGTCQIQALMDHQTFIGLSITFNSNTYTYLAYFAIAPQLRGQGYGSQALTLIKGRYPKLLLEIETTYHPKSQNFTQRIKRKKFYQKNTLKATNYTVNCYGVTMELMSTTDNYRYRDYVRLYEQIFGKKEAQTHIGLDTILLS